MPLKPDSWALSVQFPVLVLASTIRLVEPPTIGLATARALLMIKVPFAPMLIVPPPAAVALASSTVQFGLMLSPPVKVLAPAKYSNGPDGPDE